MYFPLALNCMETNTGYHYYIVLLLVLGFFPGGTGGFPIWQKFCQSPPSDTCPRFWTKACPPSAEVRPRKFKYIFVSNLTTFKLKSTLKTVFHA